MGELDGVFVLAYSSRDESGSVADPPNADSSIISSPELFIVATPTSSPRSSPCCCCSQTTIAAFSSGASPDDGSSPPMPPPPPNAAAMTAAMHTKRSTTVTRTTIFLRRDDDPPNLLYTYEPKPMDRHDVSLVCTSCESLSKPVSFMSRLGGDDCAGSVDGHRTRESMCSWEFMKSLPRGLHP